MAWEDEMLEMLRVLIDDTSASPRNTDGKLERVLVVAAFQVNQELDFTNTYTVNVSEQSITPDPTATDSREDAFTNLVCIKAACIIDRGSAGIAASRAGAFRDGGSSVDLRGVAAAKMELLKRGWCAVYDEEKTDHELGRAVVAGAVVLTPFRLYAYRTGGNPRNRDGFN